MNIKTHGRTTDAADKPAGIVPIAPDIAAQRLHERTPD